MNRKTVKYTDLALEAAELLFSASENKNISGVEMLVEETDDCDEKIKVTTVKIKNKAGEKQLGKPVGTYVTIESESMKENDALMHEKIIKILTDKLAELAKLSDDAKILIVGLGNWNVTPDALGPKVVSKILVTSHMMDCLPDELVGKVRGVSAISPGVMGLTGIETGEIVKGIVDYTKPDVVIAIDALAARNVGRINSTIQLTDTGISPGAGVGNKRMGLNIENLGVPVIAIGVPTVVDAATLVNDSLDLMLESLIRQLPEGSEFFEMLGNLNEKEKYSMIKNVLDPYTGGMFVTPKEVDSVIEHLSNIIGNALNIGIHQGISKDDINRYLY